MAQLYKMTLYVCDLEENLSLSEIKRLIEDDALDGISTSCVTHFANEKVGAHVDWDNDIDINYTSSTTDQWEKYFDNGAQRIYGTAQSKTSMRSPVPILLLEISRTARKPQ